MKDGRKIDEPNKQWRALEYLADFGEISWKSGSKDRKHRLKDQIGALRKTLKRVMGIDQDPFEPYRKVKAYKPRFILVASIGKQNSDVLSSRDDAIQDMYNEDVNRLGDR